MASAPSAPDETRRVLYLDPRLGWTETETPDARMKMASLRRVQTTGIVENTIMRKVERGGWQELNPSDIAQLSGAEQGYQFELRPRQGKEGQFVEVTCARFVDPEMAKELLQGIPLYDLELNQKKSPTFAINQFCIPFTHSHTLTQRIQAKGGIITEGQADLQVMYGQLERIGQIVKDMEVLCSQSRAVIDRIVNQGVGTDAPEIDARCDQASLLREEAAKLLALMEDAKLSVAKNVGKTEAEAHANAYVEHAQQNMQIIEQLHRENMSYKVQARMRVEKSLSQSLPGFTEGATVARRYLLMPVVEYYTDLGFDCRMIENGMILRIGDTVVELSDKPSIRGVGGESTAEQVLGRQTAERTQREL